MIQLPEVTEDELFLLKKMRGVDLHEGYRLSALGSISPVPQTDLIELAEGMVPRGLVFEFHDGRGRAWCLTHIGHDVVRRGETIKEQAE